MSRFTYAAALGCVVTTMPAAAQSLPDPTGDIVVSLPQVRAPLPLETRNALGAREIDRIAAVSLDETLRRLPSVHVPVNSRGEAVAFVRNAAERQVAVFYDGAAINVPWDNRLDLSLLPAALAGSAQVAAAPLAPLYGVNALAAISFSPQQPGGLTARALLGSGRTRDLQATAPLLSGTTELMIGGSYASRRGEPRAADAPLPFSQAGGDLRTNTDRDLASAFARIETRLGAHRVSFTAFHVTAEKGIAPESDRASGARFWRYPAVRHTLLSGNAGFALGPITALDLIGWYQRFDQTIDSFTDVSYVRRDTQEVDRDRTLGARALLTQQVGDARIVASANVLDSVHRQRDLTYAAGIAPALLPDFLRYRQRNWSLGLDASATLIDGVTGEIGYGYDRVAYLDTGDKPGIAAAQGWTGRIGLAWVPAPGWRLRANAGRKMRAPTMRELFGQALNRFLIAPDLKPERIVSGELGVDWESDRLALSAVGFVQDLDGTIDQRTVGRLRQRINLPGSTVLGIEATARWAPTPAWSLGGSGTFTRVRRKQVAAGQTNRLAERPDVLARLFGDYTAPSGLGALTELIVVGRGYSADAAGVLVPLPRSASLNLRVSQAVSLGTSAAELFARVDNATDRVVVPQIGLPSPGRSIRVGVSLGRTRGD